MKKAMTMIDYQVRLIHFPTNVKEMVVINSDDSYTIFIEENSTKEEQEESFKHAMQHIFHNDFQRCDADKCEVR